MTKEAMKLALEALTKNSDRVTEIRAKEQAITALREALADQPAQQCKWPTCQSEEYQQALAEQIKRELVGEQPAQQEPVFRFQMQLKPGWGSQYPSPCVIGDPDLNSLFGKIGDVVTFYTSPPTLSLAHQEYERGFIDGMQEQMKRSVDRAVNAMAQRTWVGLTDEEVNTLWSEWNDAVCLDYKTWASAIEAKLKERNQ